MVLDRRADKDDGRLSWGLTASGGALSPTTMRYLIELCEQHRRRVVADIRPMIEARVSAMKVGEILHLKASTKGKVIWIGE